MTSYPFNTYTSAMYNVPNFQNTMFQPPVSQAPRMEIPRVSGKDSILSYPMGPDSSAIFVSSDPNSDLGWIVTTDSAAYKTIVPCHIVPDIEEQPIKASDLEAKFAQIESRFNSIEERMNADGQHGNKFAEQNGKSNNVSNNVGNNAGKSAK